jgi:hypothetical protein
MPFVSDEEYADMLYEDWSTNKEWNMEEDDPSCRSAKVPFEGLVIRFEGKNKYDAVKLKCKKFQERESKNLDSDETNIEDTQDEI